MCFAIVIMKLNQKVRLALGLESEGRAKRSLEEKQGGSWIETVQWRDSEERRGACDRNVGIVYYSIVEIGLVDREIQMFRWTEN